VKREESIASEAGELMKMIYDPIENYPETVRPLIDEFRGIVFAPGPKISRIPGGFRIIDWPSIKPLLDRMRAVGLLPVHPNRGAW